MEIDEVLEEFRQEVEALVERFANVDKKEEGDMVVVRDWSLVIGAQTFPAGGGKHRFDSAFLNSDSPTYALAGLLRVTADEIDFGEDEED